MQIPKKFENQLWEALQGAFPTHSDLRILVQTGLEENLNNIVNPGTLPQTILDLITWATAHGKFDDLLSAARSQNPGNEILAAFSERYVAWAASQDPAGDEQTETEEDEPAVLSPPPGAVSEVTPADWLPYVSPQSVQNWVAAMQTAARAVCRIEQKKEGSSTGGYATGFLIGPRLILTTDYSIQDKNVELRFDYEYAADNITPHQGTVHKPAQHWLIDQRKNQYALILTEGTPGYDSIPGTNEQRGWLRMAPEYEVQSGEPLFFMGFYNARPLIVGHYYALVDGRESSPLVTYCAYHDIGAPGTSGAPIFNGNWEVVGLHSIYLDPRRPGWENGIKNYSIRPADEQDMLVENIKQKLGTRNNLRAGVSINYIFQQPAVQLALAISGH